MNEYVTAEHLGRAIPPRGTAYVCGFAFAPDQRVVLLRKARPAWQAGLLNGVGGKIERHGGETAHHAMAREFFEETGVLVTVDRWIKVHVERWPNGNSVDFFTVLLTQAEADAVQTIDPEEPVQLYPWNRRCFQAWGECMYNLCYLVPMAFCHLTGDPANIPAHAA